MERIEKPTPKVLLGRLARCAKSGEHLDTETAEFLSTELQVLCRREILSDEPGDSRYSTLLERYLSGLVLDIEGLNPSWVHLQASRAEAESACELAASVVYALKAYQPIAMESSYEVRRMALHQVLDALQPVIGDLPQKVPYKRTLEVPM